MPTNVQDAFHDELVALLPRLRRRAMGLVRNRADAEDLLQATVAGVLAGRGGFEPGTNLAAWLHRIMRNRWIGDLRRRRETGDIEDLPAARLAAEAGQEHGLELREALARLGPEQRDGLLMVALDGAGYERVAQVQGCALGTAKSRVFRARRTLARAARRGVVRRRRTTPRCRGERRPATVRLTARVPPGTTIPRATGRRPAALPPRRPFAPCPRSRR